VFASVEPRALFTRQKRWRRKPPPEGKGRKMKVSVYRTGKEGTKELVAKFKLSADADFFAWSMFRQEEGWMYGIKYSVEDKNSIIAKYDNLNQWRVEA
jgi:hypothetical protein